jgi:GTP cyclohydrolase I
VTSAVELPLEQVGVDGACAARTGSLRLVGRRDVDLVAARTAVADLLVALGEDAGSAHLRDTPRRVATALQEMLTAEPFSVTTFPNDEAYQGLVLVRDIAFASLCAHHLLPFHGVAHVGYLPGESLVGLSKLARVVQMFSRRLQVQESLTAGVAGWLDRQLAPRGVGVVLEAEHQCMAVRGARISGTRTVTSTLLGALRDDAREREEFLALTRR